MNLFTLFFAIVCLSASLSVSADNGFPISLEEGAQLRYFNQLQKAGLVVRSEQGRVLYEKNSQQYFIPASTTKLITALLALQHWGADYRFKTEFYLTDDQPPMLLIKGYGDPFLVSEELVFLVKQLAHRLKQQGITELAGIQLDTHYYEGGIIFSGASQTDNPYDAVSSALAANFNTLYLQKTAEGFVSAEPQTPMTPVAEQLAREVKHFVQTRSGLTKRINLGQDERLAQRYFAELLRAFLRQEALFVGEEIAWQLVSNRAVLVYEHRNRLTLEEVIQPMMKYSTNFIANQLALNLSQNVSGKPASAKMVEQVYHQRLTNQFGWQNFTLKEGAGLSRENRLSPEQLMDVLHAFTPWRDLLPEVEQRVYAKSGTLLGVSTLAGYLYDEKSGQQHWYPFVLMVNQETPYRYRNALARELSVGLK
ncbi:MAG: D-alanyl-D-alanine carboxypeptidase [Thiomicrorhabdus sp.]|nr:D-alanyl-D-alanine carboxypeptidase [Thiomicrorhabdus sp.]